jgi:uncharacterized protein
MSRPRLGDAGSDRDMADLSYSERAVAFDCCGERLVGVLAEPETSTDVGVVVVVGGPQYRVGSHRQFVSLARKLAAAGVAVLRFDYRGMGDSTGAGRSFDDVVPDIAAAIDTLATVGSIRRIVLWGLCDAASAALLYCQSTRDTRVAGIVLLNPWVRSDATIAKTHLKHYYSQRFGQKEFWAKLARGEVNVAAALRSLAGNISAAGAGRGTAGNSDSAAFQDRMADGLEAFAEPVLILLSGRDLTAKEFVEWARGSPRWRSLLDRTSVERRDIADADHTFSEVQWRTEAEQHTLHWLRRTLLAGPR